MNLPSLITEQFLTIQGEGRSVGKLAYFIRLAGCNLWCEWCDSMHSVDPQLFKGKTQTINYDLIPQNCKLVVITGGEPTLFDIISIKAEILKRIPDGKIEVETNGTRFDSAIADQFHWNISPKLSSSKQRSEHLDKARLSKITEWADYSQKNSANVVFKFVICGENDLAETHELVQKYKIQNHLVYLMPQGSEKESQQIENVKYILDFAKDHGYNFSPRLHVMFWGSRRGV